MYMYVKDDTGKTIRQNGQTTIQGHIVTYHTICVALNPLCTSHLMYVKGYRSQRSNHGIKSRQLLYMQVVFS